MNIAFNPPRLARVKEDKFRQHGDTLARMGLVKSEFHVTELREDSVVVDPSDVRSVSEDKPFTLRRDIVEFPQDES